VRTVGSTAVRRAVVLAIVLAAATLAPSARSDAQVVSPPATAVLTPKSGPAGQTVVIIGTGWSGTNPPRVTAGTPPHVAQGTATVSGDQLTGSVTIPPDAPAGSITVEVCATSITDDVNETCVSPQFLVTRPTLSLSPPHGPAGATVTVGGTGWGVPAGAPTASVLDGQKPVDTNSDISAGIRVVGGSVSGSVTIPTGVSGGKSVTIKVCVPERTTASCATASFSIDPQLTAMPATGLPGASLQLGGSWCCFASKRDVKWKATGAVVGTMQIAASGAVSGSARIPRDAAEGPAVLLVCDGNVDGPTCVVANVVVLRPTLRSDRSDYDIGAPIQLSGEGWCCPGTTVTVSDGSDGIRWGQGKVDADGRLAARPTVPDGTTATIHELSVCADKYCQSVRLNVHVPAPNSGDSTTDPAIVVPPVETPPPPPPDPHPGARFPWWLVVAGIVVVVAATTVAIKHWWPRPPVPKATTAKQPAVHRFQPRPLAVVVRIGAPHHTGRHRSMP
jgi:hypothetical protein